MKTKKKGFHLKWNSFFPEFKWTPTLRCTPELNYWGGCRCRPYSNYWGGYSQIIGGIYPPRVSAPLLEAQARDQGHKRNCSPAKKKSSEKIFRRSSKNKEKGLLKNFLGDLQKNRFSKKFFRRSTNF